LLADDHTLFAEALAKLLGCRYEVVGVAENGRKLEELCKALRPDVIVADITMPLRNGLEAARRICKSAQHPKIVFLTMHSDADLARECFKCGGSAFVSKDCAYEELTTAIETVSENQMFLSPTIATDLMDLLRNPTNVEAGYDLLTQRQREILQLFAEGKSTKDIASIVKLSARTVEWHKHRLMRALNAANNAELLRHAMRMKFVL
jgi:DNA-binding NarL/FixJ family response regulator